MNPTKSIAIASLIFQLAACNAPQNESRGEIEDADDKIDALEARVVALENALENAQEKENGSAPDLGGEPATRPTSASYILLVDGNRGAKYGSMADCEAAASAINFEADREQERRNELNRIESEKPGPPGIIYGRAPRLETHCISGD